MPEESQRELVERIILGDAEESDWGLVNTLWSVASHFPNETEEAVRAMCREVITLLVNNGWVSLYWLSNRSATEAEATTERARLQEELGLATQREILKSEYEDIPAAEVEAILRDEANWQPPTEDRYVASIATERGLKAYHALPPT
jgi:hypothetical protein